VSSAATEERTEPRRQKAGLRGSVLWRPGLLPCLDQKERRPYARSFVPGAPLALEAEALETHIEPKWKWFPSGYRDKDLAGYNVYRSDTRGLVPDETAFVDAAGTPAASGVYFCRMEVEGFRAKRRMILPRWGPSGGRQLADRRLLVLL
jgi:hypothetical protein